MYLNINVAYMYLNINVAYMYLDINVAYMYLNINVAYMYLNINVAYMYLDINVWCSGVISSQVYRNTVWYHLLLCTSVNQTIDVNGTGKKRHVNKVLCCWYFIDVFYYLLFLFVFVYSCFPPKHESLDHAIHICEE